MTIAAPIVFIGLLIMLACRLYALRISGLTVTIVVLVLTLVAEAVGVVSVEKFPMRFTRARHERYL